MLAPASRISAPRRGEIDWRRSYLSAWMMSFNRPSYASMAICHVIGWVASKRPSSGRELRMLDQQTSHTAPSSG